LASGELATTKGLARLLFLFTCGCRPPGSPGPELELGWARLGLVADAALVKQQYEISGTAGGPTRHHPPRDRWLVFAVCLT
jgi:hypothetical protein